MLSEGRADVLLDLSGLDTIGGGMMVSFAMECFENGIITEADTGGLKLSFGNGEAMVKLLEMTVNREGIFQPTNLSRPLEGQAPYVLNVGLNYATWNGWEARSPGSSITLFLISGLWETHSSGRLASEVIFI